jgi:hypothetical protein
MIGGSWVSSTHYSSQLSTKSSQCGVSFFRNRQKDRAQELLPDPTVLVSSLVVQLVSLPSGKALEAILPTKQFRTFGTMWSLNPGPFNVKEHVVISIMANVASYGTIATDIVAAQRLYYGQVVPLHYQILLAFCIQIFGIAIAGIFSQFLVWPSAMIWPGALVNAALLNTLHSSWHVKESKKHVSRRKFFLITLACSFIWYWVPGYLWTGLSFFNWVCWIAPNNVVVNQVFGTVTGLGLGMFTFDWATIAYIGSPLVTPVCRYLRMCDQLTDVGLSGGPKRTSLRPSCSLSGSLRPSYIVGTDRV